MQKEPLYSVLPLLDELYGIEMDEDQFETLAMIAYKKIGNKDFKIKITRAFPQPDPCGGWYVCKPCDVDLIEAITLPFEDAQETSNIINYPGFYTHDVEEDIEWQKIMPNELYLRGKFVKYKELGDKIYFTEPFPMVQIMYKSSYLDEDGLPYINSKEQNAIAAYCAYSYYYRKGIKTKDSATMQIAASLKTDWLKLCSEARVAEALSQNDMNEILDTQVSWDRHNFGRTSKPIK